MTTRYRKGMKPLALAEHWARLGLDHDELAKGAVVQWIRKIHDSVQPSFVAAGVNPDFLLRSIEARNMIHDRMVSTFQELPQQLRGQSAEVVVPALYSLYHLIRCAYPTEWGLSLPQTRPPRQRHRGSTTTTAPGAQSLGNDGMAATPHGMAANVGQMRPPTTTVPAPQHGITATLHGMAANVGQMVDQTVDSLRDKLDEDMDAVLDEMQGVHDEMDDLRREMGIMRQEMKALWDRVYALEHQ
ncbi:hypothetical protein N7535_000448 [Penicillium sp. DV-2018c]|nr:hypothetical protein N7535_000448 [Penicillium sp. DV-2018c]